MSVNNIKFFINFMCYRLFNKFYLIVLIVEVTVLIITVMLCLQKNLLGFVLYLSQLLRITAMYFLNAFLQFMSENLTPKYVTNLCYYGVWISLNNYCESGFLYWLSFLTFYLRYCYDYLINLFSCWIVYWQDTAKLLFLKLYIIYCSF